MTDLSIEALRAICEQLQGTAGHAAAERRLILAALKETDGDRGKAANLAGISLRTLYRRLKDMPEAPPAPTAQDRAGPGWTLPCDGVIVAALHEAGGNKSAACRALGLHPQALQSWPAKPRTQRERSDAPRAAENPKRGAKGG